MCIPAAPAVQYENPIRDAFSAKPNISIHPKQLGPGK